VFLMHNPHHGNDHLPDVTAFVSAGAAATGQSSRPAVTLRARTHTGCLTFARFFDRPVILFDALHFGCWSILRPSVHELP